MNDTLVNLISCKIHCSKDLKEHTVFPIDIMVCTSGLEFQFL